MILQLADRNSTVLRSPTKEVTKITDITRQFCNNLLDTMRRFRGVGLAANQTGSEFCIAVIENKQLISRPLILINPQIVEQSETQFDSQEGCLSLLGESHLVRRPKWITIKYLDQHGKEKMLKAKRALARIVAHELDHLSGVCIDQKDVTSPSKLPKMKG